MSQIYDIIYGIKLDEQGKFSFLFTSDVLLFIWMVVLDVMGCLNAVVGKLVWNHGHNDPTIVHFSRIQALIIK